MTLSHAIRLAGLAVLLASAGCAGSRPDSSALPGVEPEFNEAKRAYEGGNYVRAAELLSAFVSAHPGSSRLDEILLLLGRAHQKTRENLLAVEDFERLIRDFPQSPFREEAEFERAESHLSEALGAAYDAENTEIALSLYRSYRIRYPQGRFIEGAMRGESVCLERLAKKAYLNALTYRKLRRPAAERIYLEKALETKPDFESAGEALAGLARVCDQLGDSEGSTAAWRRLIDFATPERIQARPRLQALRREAEAATSGLPQYAPEETAR